MSPLTRMTKKRDHWKALAVTRATVNREERKLEKRLREKIAILDNKIETLEHALENSKKKSSYRGDESSFSGINESSDMCFSSI